MSVQLPEQDVDRPATGPVEHESVEAICSLQVRSGFGFGFAVGADREVRAPGKGSADLTSEGAAPLAPY